MPDISPAPTPAEVLKKIEATTTARKTAASTGSSGWWAALIVFVLSTAAAVIYWYIDRKNRQELARLRHEQQVALIQAAQAKTDGVVEGTVILTEALRSQRLVLTAKALQLGDDIKKMEAQRAADKLAIDRIRSWDDVHPPAPGPPGQGG